MAFRSVAGFVVIAASSLLACLGPNPYLGANDDAGSSDATSSDSSDSDSTDTGPETSSDTQTDTGDHCNNGTQDGDETGLDCGGSCGPCEDGQPCEVAQDCQSGVCDDTCLAPACDDDVQNGDEIAVDCGGPCRFCEHSEFLSELDDFEGSAANLPKVTMFANGVFTVSFSAAMKPHARWFAEDGSDLGPSLELGAGIVFTNGERMPIDASDELGDVAELLVPGMNMMSDNTDLFLLRHGADDSETLGTRLNDTVYQVTRGDIVVDGDQVIAAWEQGGQVFLRRWDWSVANGVWIDIEPHMAEEDPAAYQGGQPALSLGVDGTVAIAWVRCAANGGYPCSVVGRRFNSDWVDPDPVVATQTEEYFSNPRIARGADGRCLLVWNRVDLDNQGAQARLFDKFFFPQASVWTLQTSLPSTPDPDVVALSDDSFAVAWTDVAGDRVHLRRYVDADTPKLPDLGDEAPWPNTIDPRSVALAAIDGRLVAVWSATVDMVQQVQGQVLSF